MKRQQRRASGRIESTAGSRFIVLTGLSGAGKSQAVRALEDLGYFCVDNLPTTLMPTLAELTRKAGTGITRVAVVVDVREGPLLATLPAIYRKLRATPGLNPRLIFLEATDEALVRRFSETRRPHPLAPGSSAVDGIREERIRLKPIRAMADAVVDTTDMTVHELRRRFLGMARDGSNQHSLVVTLLSFGFKHGLPTEADLVFDVRFLPNPQFVPSLRPKTGREAAVRRYLFRHQETGELIDRVEGLLKFLIPRYVAEGKRYLTVAIGCTGGRHRSVTIAEALRKALRDVSGIRLRIKHRDIVNE